MRGNMTTESRMTAYATLWVLADFLAIPKLQNEVMEILVRVATAKHGFHSYPMLMALENTHKDSALWRFAVANIAADTFRGILCPEEMQHQLSLEQMAAIAAQLLSFLGKQGDTVPSWREMIDCREDDFMIEEDGRPYSD